MLSCLLRVHVGQVVAKRVRNIAETHKKALLILNFTVLLSDNLHGLRILAYICATLSYTTFVLLELISVLTVTCGHSCLQLRRVHVLRFLKCVKFVIKCC